MYVSYQRKPFKRCFFPNSAHPAVRLTNCICTTSALHFVTNRNQFPYCCSADGYYCLSCSGPHGGTDHRVLVSSQSNLNKLQRVQNAVARTVMTTSGREHITPVLAELHCPPVAARVDFKITVITFNLLTTEQPSYLRELLQLRRPSRSLTSSNLMNIPRPCTAFVQRSSACAAPRV